MVVFSKIKSEIFEEPFVSATDSHPVGSSGFWRIFFHLNFF